MQTHPPVDVVTVGAGWTAAIVAQQLTEAGLDVVSLERGKAQWTWPDFAHNHDYLKYNNRNEMQLDLSRESWTWRPNVTAPALPIRQYGDFQPGQGLGGSGAHWTGLTWRFLPMDFRYRSHHIERYGIDKLPEGNAIRDWPISYDELEPFYDQWEYDIGVSGQTGNLNGTIVAGGNPFEGPRSRPYPLPPLSSMTHGEMFADACRELGYHPFMIPTAILSRGYTDMSGRARAGCLYCGHCTRFGCEVDAKGSPLTAHIPMALDTGRYEIRTRSTVIGVEVNDRGLATGLRYLDRHGREHFQPAARVFLTGFTFTNVRLMMLARSAAHPEGLGNNQGFLGNNFTYQVYDFPIRALFPDRQFNAFMGNGATRPAIYDFQADVFDHSDLDFMGGGYIRLNGGEQDPIAMLDDVLLEDQNARQWGQTYKDALPTAYRGEVEVNIHAEDMAYEGQFLDLDPNYTDSLGLPLLRITYDHGENERNMYRFLAERAEEIVRAMGPARMRSNPEIGPYHVRIWRGSHMTGGAIMGTDPSNSVTNKYGQVWDAPNVFVTGAAQFPQNPGANPTETVCALTYYALDALKRGFLHDPEELMT